jgi:cysteine-rich repeat protein
MPSSARRVLRLLPLLALAPALAGAHCNEDCSKPRMRSVARPSERTLYGPGVLFTAPQVTPLAEALSGFDKRSVRVDASRPVAVVLVNHASWAELRKADPGRLAAGDGGDAYRVLAVLDHAASVPLFPDPAALADARRLAWDAVALVPREAGAAPWEAAVVVETGRAIPQVNDPADGHCVDRGAVSGEAPSFLLLTLPQRCGDGVRQDEEDCDDGNRRPGDGCSPYCTRER